MALTPDTDQFSQFLRLAFFRSPNFVTGVSGWDIEQNGHAEFNDIVIRNGQIISGTFLLYSGNPPAKGNLVLAFAPIAGGTDSVGNVYPQGFNFGVWNASGTLVQHFGIDDNGKLYLVDSSGKIRIFLDPSLAAQLIYDSSGQSAGHLTSSVASAGGTDSAGNTFYAGVAVYNAAPVNAITQLLNGFLQVGTPGQIAGTGGAAPGLVGLASGGNPGVVRIDSGLTATGDSDAFVDVRSKNAQSSINAVAQRNIQLAGPLALSSEGSAPAQLVTAAVYDGGNGFARMRTGSVTSDTIVYQVGHAIFRNTTDQTGIGTSATVITGLSANLGIGLYNFRGMVSIANPTGGTITPSVGFSGSGGLAAANLDVGCEWYSSTAGTFKGAGKVSVLGNSVSTTSGQAAAEVCYMKFDGVINVSTPGTFQVFALGTAINLTVKAFSRIVHWQDN